jgi:hypothetical protein
MLKDELYSNNAHTEDNLKGSIQVLESSVLPTEIQFAVDNMVL